MTQFQRVQFQEQPSFLGSEGTRFETNGVMIIFIIIASHPYQTTMFHDHKSLKSVIIGLLSNISWLIICDCPSSSLDECVSAGLSAPKIVKNKYLFALSKFSKFFGPRFLNEPRFLIKIKLESILSGLRIDPNHSDLFRIEWILFKINNF